MKKFFLLASFLLCSQSFAITADEALSLLREGNQRYLNDQLVHCENPTERRLMVKKDQEPIAVVLTCSDSRVFPEIIFDQPLGKLFVIRVSGNVVGGTEMDSIYFATHTLNVPLVVVLGHERCGAVKAVLDKNTKGFSYVSKFIKEAINGKALTWKEAVEANVLKGVRLIKNYDPLAPLFKENKLQVVGAYYDFDKCNIKWLLPFNGASQAE